MHDRYRRRDMSRLPKDMQEKLKSFNLIVVMLYTAGSMVRRLVLLLASDFSKERKVLAVSHPKQLYGCIDTGCDRIRVTRYVVVEHPKRFFISTCGKAGNRNQSLDFVLTRKHLVDIGGKRIVAKLGKQLHGTMTTTPIVGLKLLTQRFNCLR